MKRTLFLILFTCIAFSCKKEYHTTIPNNYPVRVELWINTSDSELQTSLAYKVILESQIISERFGFGGVLVINGMGEAPINIYAYDLACPEEARRDIRVVPDILGSSTSAVKTAITATCPNCGAVFNIATGTGSPASGSKYYLRSYKVVYNKTWNSYTVFN